MDGVRRSRGGVERRRRLEHHHHGRSRCAHAGAFAPAARRGLAHAFRPEALGGDAGRDRVGAYTPAEDCRRRRASRQQRRERRGDEQSESSRMLPHERGVGSKPRAKGRRTGFARRLFTRERRCGADVPSGAFSSGQRRLGFGGEPREPQAWHHATPDRRAREDLRDGGHKRTADRRDRHRAWRPRGPAAGRLLSGACASLLPCSGSCSRPAAPSAARPSGIRRPNLARVRRSTSAGARGLRRRRSPA